MQNFEFVPIMYCTKNDYFLVCQSHLRILIEHCIVSMNESFKNHFLMPDIEYTAESII